MSDLTLKIRGDFSQARRAFEELAESSTETREQMEQFAESLTASELEEFNRKQRRIQDSMRGTRGETAALEQSSRNYQRQIEQLIRQGFDPNSTAVRELTREQQRLQREVDNSRKAKERKTKAVKAAKKALKASAVAVAGLVTGVIALTKRNANLANGLANSARVVGMTTEAYQELDYAMRMSGIENGDYMLNRMNRSIIDVRNETGHLTKFLENNYYELLRQLQGVENNEEAFTLLMDAIHRAPNEFAAAELAMAAFGRNGAQMVLAAQNGAEGINALREEARQLGIISNENAESAMAFNDAMFRLRTTVRNMTQELTAQLLPALTNVVVRLTNAIQRAGEFRARLQGLIGVVRTLVPYIGVAAAGIAGFVGGMKSVAVVKTFIQKMVTLKNTFVAIRNAIQATKKAHLLFTAIKTKGVGLAAGVTAGLAAMAIANNRIRNAMREATEATGEFKIAIEDLDFSMFDFAAESIADLGVALTKLAWGGAAEAVEAMETVTKKNRDNLRQRLSDVEYTANQERNININAIQAFLTQRAELESDDREERKAEINRMGWYLLNSEHLVAEERVAIAQAVENAIQAMQEETAKKAEQAANNMLKAYSVFFGGFSSLLGVAGRENRRFFMASRAMAIVQAGINTALAVTKALAQGGLFGAVKAIGIGMKGAAQKAKIASSMIPSAETGGRFVVPPSRGVDNSIMRLNEGETVEVTPRGMAGQDGGSFNFNFIMDGQVFAEVINKKARAGELYTLQLAGNL